MHGQKFLNHYLTIRICVIAGVVGEWGVPDSACQDKANGNIAALLSRPFQSSSKESLHFSLIKKLSNS